MKKKPFLYLHQYIYIINKENLEQKKFVSSVLDEGDRKSDHPGI